MTEKRRIRFIKYCPTFYQSLPQVDDDDLVFETFNQRRCASSISSSGHCQMFLPPQISNTLEVRLRPMQKLCSGSFEQRYTVVITSTPRFERSLQKENVSEVLPFTIIYVSWCYFVTLFCSRFGGFLSIQLAISLWVTK